MRKFKDYLGATFIVLCSGISPTAYADRATIESNCTIEMNFFSEVYDLIKSGNEINPAPILARYNALLIPPENKEIDLSISTFQTLEKRIRNAPSSNFNYNHCVTSASKGGYDPSASKSDSSYAPSVNKPLISPASNQESPDKLCKSYGLKKGTSTYANCMIKTREQNLLLQKNQEEINEKFRQNEAARAHQEEENTNRELDRRNAEKLQREAAQRQIDAETEKNIRELNRLEQQRLQKEATKKAEDNAADWRAITAQGKLMMQPGYQWGDTEQSYNLRMQEQKAQEQQQRLINEIINGINRRIVQ